MRNTIKNALLSLFFYSVSAFGISLSIKASIGVSAFNAMNLSVSEAIHVKVGTVTSIMNLAFLLGYIILSRFRYPWKYVLQAVSTLLFGTLINFFTYTLLHSLELSSYGLRVAVIAIGTVIGGLAVGMIIRYNVLTFPIESFCLEVEARSKISFAALRYGADGFFLLTSVLISWTQGLPLFIREGTVINMLLLTASMNFIKRKLPVRA